MKEIVESFIKKQNEWMEYTLKNKAMPPIKGEITRGKLRYRGITLCVQNSSIHHTVFIIKQRGKTIGKFNLTLDLSIDYTNTTSPYYPNEK